MSLQGLYKNFLSRTLDGQRMWVITDMPEGEYLCVRQLIKISKQYSIVAELFLSPAQYNR